MNHSAVLNAIYSMKQSGQIRNRRECLTALHALGCSDIRLDAWQITARAPDGEHITFRGLTFSTYYSASAGKTVNMLGIIMLLTVLAGVISRLVWGVSFDGITNDEAWWHSLPESMRSGLNLCGYVVPAAFWSVSLACVSLMTLIIAWQICQQGMAWGTERILAWYRRKTR